MFKGYDAGGGDGSSFWALYSDGFSTVKVTGQPGNKAAEASAAQAAFDTLYAAAPKRKFASVLIANAKITFNALYTMSEGFRTGDGSIGGYRALMLSVINIINTLPAPFITEFNAEVAGKQLASTATNSTWTAAQCAAWHAHLGDWLARAGTEAALAAAAASDLD